MKIDERMKTIELKIWGIVQGVGFRPFLSKIARRSKLKGWVINEGGYVSAKLSGTEEALEQFLKNLMEKKPEPAEIVHLEKRDVPYEEFKAFEIKESEHGSDGIVMLPADLSVCPSCKRELESPEDPRYRHPFISCMECGPRYSIIDRVPYDRHNTAMIDFPMCDYCEGQYRDPEDRRYHAQTISCHDCGPYLMYRERQADGSWGDMVNREEALQRTIKQLNDGKIVAIKGIGGFHLACRPDNTESVKALRLLKGREEKPFAVMFPSLENLKKYCKVNDKEKVALEGKEKPILLLEVKKEAMSFFSHEVSRSSRLLGAFLPYTGLQYLLLEKTGPLIMTSGNLSDEPIQTEEEELFAMKDMALHGVLYNKRKIRTGEDDSVARVMGNKLRVTRRARGYVPIPVFMEGIGKRQEKITEGYEILSTGGELKNTFCLSKGAFAYLSQYFGDLDSLRIHEIYEKNIERMKEMLRVRPKLVVCDLHPGYFSSAFGKKYGEQNGIPVLTVQHHEAHVASVIAEHGLKGNVLGLAFDGTGFGRDGRIWGSEFLLWDGTEFSREGHLEEVKLVGGDSSSKDGWKAAFSYLKAYDLYEQYKETLDFPIKEDQRNLLEKALKMNINTAESTSMGRLFDVVSFLLGFCSSSDYEGDAAIRLENGAFAHKKVTEGLSFEFMEEEKGGIKIRTKSLLEELLRILAKDPSEVKRNELAWRFHCTIKDFSVLLAKKCREKTGVSQIALSGGVFQNKLLFEMIGDAMEAEGFKVYSNEKVPVNDGGISLGQAYLGALMELSKKN